ncbi:hypothetical protein C8F01DRAFT_786607 [Mycena amicta]|nr:hypothetical protein C8F01DRAFT_786607 [Mycena amicta]
MIEVGRPTPNHIFLVSASTYLRRNDHRCSTSTFMSSQIDYTLDANERITIPRIAFNARFTPVLRSWSGQTRPKQLIQQLESQYGENAYGHATNHLFLPIGSSLVDSKDPSSLFRSAMLRWLAILKAGFLHREISIGNLLRFKEVFTIEWPFKIDDSLAQPHDETTPAIDSLSLNDPLSDDPHDYKTQAERVQRLLRDLGVEEKAFGFMIDDDDAVKWHEFGPPRRAARSGTYEFMSDNLREALQNHSEYLHSPVDDLHSFYYVAQWAAAFHQVDGDHPSLERLRAHLAGTGRAEATNKIRALRPLRSDQELYGKFVPKCGRFLRAWHLKLGDLRGDYKEAFEPFWKPENRNSNHLQSLFFTFAYRGVADYMEVLVEWQSKASWGTVSIPIGTILLV